MLCGPDVPVLPDVSDCVTVIEYTPSAASAVVGVKVHALAVQAAVPFCVVAPVIATETVGFTPPAVVQAPPIVVTVALVMYGNVRAVPLTVVSVTVGAAVLMVIDCGPDVPVFVAVSVWVAVIVYVPCADRAGEAVYVQTPAEQVAVPFWVAAPVTATFTVVESPAAVPHAPATDVMLVLVLKGNVRTVPLTVVSVMTGAVRSTVIVWAPLVPVFAAPSDWVAVTAYAPLTASELTNV